MTYSLLQNSMLRKAGKAALVAAVLGLALLPRESFAKEHCLNYCAHFCPQYIANYCVRWKDTGRLGQVQTNPCFACRAAYCVLYLGQCKY